MPPGNRGRSTPALIAKGVGKAVVFRRLSVMPRIVRRLIPAWGEVGDDVLSRWWFRRAGTVWVFSSFSDGHHVLRDRRRLGPVCGKDVRLLTVALQRMQVTKHAALNE